MESAVAAVVGVVLAVKHGFGALIGGIGVVEYFGHVFGVGDERDTGDVGGTARPSD
jgi:hypothetical protein